jgi:meiotic recombination protein SPO11
MLDQVENLNSDAEFVLVIEKDAVFQDLAEDKFFNYIPCILVTASGQPDMATRMFIKKLHEDLHLPILGFLDADPYGLDILRVYSIGSKALSFESVELAVPEIRWLGLLPSDIEEYRIPKSVLIKMTDNDIKRADDLLEEDFVKSRPEWQKQILIMKNTREKAEIQALASKDWRFMTGTYLPNKINSADWV